MKKEELMKLEGMTEEVAVKVMEIYDAEKVVPKTRLDEVIAERDNAKTSNADLLKQIGDLRKETGDVQSLKDKIKELEDGAKETEKTHAAEIKTMKINNAVDTALVGAKALNVKAVKALLNLDGAELDADGSVKGLADQIKALQTAEDSKFMFGSSTMKGAKTGESGNDDGGKGVDTSKMTYSELAAYAAEHPDFKFE
jgi:hypothetical protein